MTKRCGKCGTDKPLEAFNKASSSSDGRQGYCRECTSAYQRGHRQANPEKVKSWNAQDLERHGPRRSDPIPGTAAHAERLAYMAEWRAQNREAARAAVRAWQKANPGKTLSYGGERRARNLRQTIALTAEQKAEIVAIYDEANRLTRETGVPHHVDHEVPLKGKGVCGLHVPWNLRPLPAVENLRKGNR